MTISDSAEAVDAHWYLTEFTEVDGCGHRVPVNKSPFRIGRLPELAFPVNDQTVSKVHAELVADRGRLVVRDLQSTNGTYVNGHRVYEAMLRPGDMVQFANCVFRVSSENAGSSLRNTIARSHSNWPHGLLQFDKLMTERAIVPHYQPIVTIAGHETVGYELLARSNVKGLETAGQLFATAAQLNQEAALSAMVRNVGLVHGQRFGGRLDLFVNTHPAELEDFGLVESLRQIRELIPQQPITLEIHESSVTKSESMQRLRESLRILNIRLAYDDFGAGQARLLELTEVPPDYLKFDMRLIRDIHSASPQRQQMLASLVKMVRDLGIAPLAEGVECLQEAVTCCQMGFHLAQGYFFGRPAPLA